ncbi:MAG: hypothetical protein EPO40_03670 [Myxococcaceae bacterium]|nr:MAG: hypothetical protein EPO40_03670 [Myxococcaceae bacterium]
MKLLRRVSFVQLLCLLAAMSVATPACADPGSFDEAIARLFGAVIWNAMGAPSLPGEVQDSQALPALGGERGVMLLTLSRPEEADPGSLMTLVWTGSRWTLSEAQVLPVSSRSEVHWGLPLWFGERRVLVVEGARFGVSPEDSGSWREFFVVDANGSLRHVGTLQSTQPEAEQRSNGMCVWLGESALRCWDPATQVLR